MRIQNENLAIFAEDQEEVRKFRQLNRADRLLDMNALLKRRITLEVFPDFDALALGRYER